MVSATAAYVSMAVTLAGVTAFTVFMGRKMELTSAKQFVSAKNTQSAMRLAFCLFSAGTGSWTLFSFPEIGVLAGAWGVIGYTLSSLLALTVLSMAGPYCRAMLGEGMTFADFLHRRYGRVMQVYVACVAIFFQFISLASELTCVGDLVLLLSPFAMPEVPIVGVAVITNVYLITGGLRATLTTNVLQGMAVVTLVLVVCTAIFIHISVPDGAWGETQIAAFTSDGFEVLVTLCIAITASSLFQTGYWQRVFAANDDKALKQACWYAAFIVIPFTVFLAFAGMVSFLAYPEGIYLFSLLVDMGTFWQVVVAIVVASLASAVSNSLQLGIVAEIITNFPQVDLFYARAICFALNIPAVGIALKHYNILDMFLVADLLCTATVGPMLMSVWPRTHYIGAIAGCAAGLVTIFLCGCTVERTFVGGFNWFLLPEGLYSTNSMITFVLALFVPIIVTFVVSMSLPQQELPPMPVPVLESESEIPEVAGPGTPTADAPGSPTQRDSLVRDYTALRTPPPMPAPATNGPQAPLLPSLTLSVADQA